MKFGIAQYAATPDGKRFVETAAQLKLAGVEPYIESCDSEFLKSTHENRIALKRLAEAHNIDLPSVCLGAFNVDPSIVTSDGFEKAVGIVVEALHFTHDVGGQLMLLCTYVVSNPDTPAKKQLLINVVRAAEPLAREFGIRIALENPLPAEELVEVIDTIGSNHVGVYYDYGNALANEFDPAREIPILGERIFAIHAKDSITGKLGGLHLGDGDLNLEAAMRATWQIGYDGWIVLETPSGDDSATCRDIQAIRHVAQACAVDAHDVAHR